MSMPDVVEFIEHYADFAKAPVNTHTTVRAVRPRRGGYRVVTNRGQWQARAVIIASGACNMSSVPGIAASLPARVRQLTPHQYRGPRDVQPGGVLVGIGQGWELAAELVGLADLLPHRPHDVDHLPVRHPLAAGPRLLLAAATGDGALHAVGDPGRRACHTRARPDQPQAVDPGRFDAKERWAALYPPNPQCRPPGH